MPPSPVTNDPMPLHVNRRSGRLALMLVGAGVLFLVILGLVFFLGRQPTSSSPPLSEEKSGEGSAVRSVQVMKPQRRDVAHTLTLPANISPWYQATLYGKVSGYLKWIGFDKGDVVKSGELLAVIDAPEIADQFHQAQADYDIKRVTYERYLSVWNDNHDIIAKQDVDVAKAAALSAKHLRDSRKTLLDYTKVYAPFSGTITARFADPGALIQAATGSATQAAPLFTIMDMEKVRVYVNVPQEAAFLAKTNIPATLTVRELPNRRFEGVISRTTEALDPATRTLLVEIDLPNKDHVLQPGMFANVTLQLQQHANALVIAPAAIVPQQGAQAKSVFIVEQDQIKSVPIKTGIDDGVWVEILEGLTGDEDIVVVGKGGLKEGEHVKASPYNLPAGKPAQQKL
jgi:membrane fusion protein, multidrug efflux system